MKKNKRSDTKARSPREYLQSMHGRDDLHSIGQLGLWSAFVNEEAVRRFAALSKAERRAFFERYAEGMSDEPSSNENKKPRSASHAPLAADYRLFDLSPHASMAQVHSRYRELALTFHPDRNDGDTELMQKINEAYRRLQGRAL
jgi:DnaJ-domain-containing protein 1